MFYRLLAINALPCVLLGVIIWWTQRRDCGRLTGWRRALFVTALVVNAVGSVSLLIFIAWLAFGEGRPFGGVVEDRLFLWMIGLGLLSAGIGASGRGFSRGLLIVNGVLVALQWWLLAAVGL
jgi:hypothetical protein